MKNAKKWMTLLLSAVLVTGMMTGCSSEKESMEETTEAPSTESGEGTGSFDYSAGLTDEGMIEGVHALDYVTLPEYKNIKVTSDIYEISDASVQSQVDSLMAGYTDVEHVTDRAVVDGDSVNIDYVGSVDGVEFDGGSTGGYGTTVTIGVTNYIDDFLEQLIGHTPGETFNVEVTFPEDYGKDDLNGKDAVFVTTINYIEGDAVAPEMTDNFVAENFEALYGWTTVDGMYESLRSDMQKTAEQDYIIEYLMENAAISEIPDAAMDYQKATMINYYTSGAETYGMDLETFLSALLGVSTIDELVEQSQDNLTTAAKQSLIFQAVAEDLGMTVSDDELPAYFLERIGVEDYSEIEEYYGIGYIKMSVMYENVLTYMYDNLSRV